MIVEIRVTWNYLLRSLMLNLSIFFSRFQHGDNWRERGVTSFQAIYGFSSVWRQSHLRRSPDPSSVGADSSPLLQSVSTCTFWGFFLCFSSGWWEEKLTSPRREFDLLTASVITDQLVEFTHPLFLPWTFLFRKGEVGYLSHKAIRQIQAHCVMHRQ